MNPTYNDYIGTNNGFWDKADEKEQGVEGKEFEAYLFFLIHFGYFTPTYFILRFIYVLNYL